MSEVTSSLIEFLSEATTPFHAVSAIVKRLSSAGFTPWDEASADSPAAGSKHYWIKNGSTVIAFTAGKRFSRRWHSLGRRPHRQPKSGG